MRVRHRRFSWERGFGWELRPNRTWRAYLSTSSENARDRIGTGPWYNVRLQEIAPDVATLHENGIARLEWFVTDDPEDAGLVIDEHGELVPLLEHDIITGSQMDGTVSEGRRAGPPVVEFGA